MEPPATRQSCGCRLSPNSANPIVRLSEDKSMSRCTPVLAKDVVGGHGQGIEIKVRYSVQVFSAHKAEIGLLTLPDVSLRLYASSQDSDVQILYAFASQGTERGNRRAWLLPYSGDESRAKKALSSLWDAWVYSDGAVNSFRVFVRGRIISPVEKFSIVGITNDLADPKEALLATLLLVLMDTPVLNTLAYRQRTLDPLDIEGLAALLAGGGSPPADPVRFHSISYLLSATSKDCSVILRVPDGTATVQAPRPGPEVAGAGVGDRVCRRSARCALIVESNDYKLNRTTLFWRNK
ncbi:hypothetical protein FB451DRAFT_1404809 [Mycena latifolia]|nr:hypothetical protein FB451DRAFT_1404809 [Mycena latifolia]